jgi:hypothetical protein
MKYLKKKMIVSTNNEESIESFVALLEKTRVHLFEDAKNDPYLLVKQSASEFEEYLYHALNKSADKTPFKGTIKLIGGYRFPDIVVKKYYGVEVKTTKQDKWTSTGNSILETTRIDGVEKIFIFFAKLSMPPEFCYRKYQECLNDIAVTHSPRYMINMKLESGQSIFDKMNVQYDDFRHNPIKVYIKYLRKKLKPGEELWWVNGEEESTVRPVVRLFSNLDKKEKSEIVTEAMVLFPEIFGNLSTKYQRLATWLVTKYGVVDSSLRDKFTAGGKVSIPVGGNQYQGVPRIFKKLMDKMGDFLEKLKTISPDELEYYWKDFYDPGIDRYDLWAKQFLLHGKRYVGFENEKLLINIIGYYYPNSDIKPDFLKEKEERYGLRY